ncbi:ATP synthase F0 subcomplex subunit OSCP atp5 [Ceratobasidium sp. 392]|nr:ATP synthase F0 subcomplex subunit OSCP atp5 [Ceratobasidium sp. 392]
MLERLDDELASEDAEHKVSPVARGSLHHFKAELNDGVSLSSELLSGLISDRSSNGLDAIFAAAAPKGSKEPVSSITRNLFVILSENGRVGETNGAIESFNELLSEHKGEVEVVVTSAAPLEKSLLSRLEASLKASQAASQAKTVRVTNKVNPSILGGLLVDFGDKTIDLSVFSKVNKLNALLQQSV